MRVADWIAGVAGLHRAPFAGLLAAALAVPFTWALHWIGGFPLVALAVVIGAAKVIWALPRAAVPLIADRMVGQLLALSALSGGLWFAGVAGHVFPWPGWVTGFVLCQALTAALAPRLPHIWNDLAAGAATAGLTLIGAGAAHGWF